MIIYILWWIGLGTLTKIILDSIDYFKPPPKTTKYDSKEPFRTIDNLNLSKPIELENVPIEDVEVEYIHSITWCARSRNVTDIEFKNLI